MKILHTSDWHLGHTFREQKRNREFASFFTWLESIIKTEGIDVLIMAGDVFDSGTPGNQALELYFDFLGRIAKNPGCQVIIVAGNHDSPSLLTVPKSIFSPLDIHVIGSTGERPEEEVLVLYDRQGHPALIVGAVPFLRDRDVRMVEPGESIDDKTRKLLDGIKKHYHEVCTCAESLREKTGKHIPLVVTGHLFAAGGKVAEDDGVREHYIGSLVRVRADTFLSGIDYLALGHLHIPQVVGNNPRWRYSGSPLPMGFSDAAEEKQVIVAEFNGSRVPEIREIPVPCFQKMEQITGTMDEITARIRELKSQNQPIWIEVILDDPSLVPDFRDQIITLTKGTTLTVLGTKNLRLADQVLRQASDEESLDQLTETDIFNRCLDANDISPAERTELLALFAEILAEVKVNNAKPEGEA